MAQFQRGWWRPAAVISSAAFVAVLSTSPINALAEEASSADGAQDAVNEQLALPEETNEPSEKATGAESSSAVDETEKNATLPESEDKVSESDDSADEPKVEEPSSPSDSENDTAAGADSKSDESVADKADDSSSATSDSADASKGDKAKENPGASKAEDEKSTESAKSSDVVEPEKSSNKTIADGTYVIGSGNKMDLVADAQNGGRSNGTNAQLFESNNTASQKWDVKYHDKDGGYYTIGLHGTNLVLDVQWGEAKNGSNVWLYESNGSKAQRWTITKNAKGLWTVLSQLGNFYLDAQQGGKTNGTNLQIFAGNGTPSQSFYFFQYNPSAPTGDARPIDDGIYVIGSNKANGNKVLDISNGSMDNRGNVQLFQGNGTSAQRFYFEYDGEGYYTITNLGSGKVLDIADGGIMPGTNVQQFASNNTAAQKWSIRKENGLYYLVNKWTGLALDAEWGGTSNGTNIWAYFFDKSAAQRWRLTKDDGFIKTGSDGSAIYVIASSKNTGRLFDIKNGSSADGAALQLWDSNGSSAQHFEVHSLGNDEYRIRTAASGGWLTIQNGKIVQLGNSKTAASESDTWKAVWKGGYFSLINANGFALDLTSGSSAAGTLVQAFKANGTAAQHFFFRAADLIKNGYYTIATALSENKMLDVTNEAFKDNTNIQIYASNGKNAQKFKITKSGSGYLISSSVKDGSTELFLDADNEGKVNGTNVKLFHKNGKLAQLWKAEISDGGGIVFINVGSGLALDVANGNSSNGSNVQLYEANGSKAQSWKLTETTISSGWVFVGGNWTFEGKTYSTSVYNAWQRIKDMSGAARNSSYGVQPYIITIDNTACRVAVFQGSQGNWRPLYDWAAGVGDASAYGHGTFLSSDPNIGGKGLDMFIGYNWDGTQIHNPSIPSDGLVAFTSFFGAQGFHSTCGNHSDPSQTGKQISHGCVRLLEANAWWIYNNAPLGTLVYSF